MQNQCDIDAAIELVKESLNEKVPQYKLIEFIREVLGFSLRKSEEFVRNCKAELREFA